ncbi:MAG TPA: hypothetical protein VNA25_21510 [Phycisphaerae bacterium]|nr:hypothetical protein [Phycisphaerae bacterium]
MLKRLVGSALRNRRYDTLNHEILLRVLTINLMILWLLWRSFQQSMTVPPFQVTGNLARVYVRTGRKDDKTRQLLTDVIMKDARPDWVAWAREKLAMMGQPATGPVPFGEQGPPERQAPGPD